MWAGLGKDTLRKGQQVRSKLSSTECFRLGGGGGGVTNEGIVK